MNKTLRSLLILMCLSVAASVSAAVDNLYITGGFTNPSWSATGALAMTKDADGYFTYDVPAEGGSCKISSVLADWDAGFNASAKSYVVQPKVGGDAVALQSSTSNIDVPASESGVTIKIDPDFTTIQFVGVASTAVPDVYLVGANYGSWSASDDYKFAYKETNASGEYVYTLDVASLAGEFKIANSTWTINFGGVSISENGEYTLVSGTNQNCSAAGTFTDVTLTFYYNQDAGTGRLSVAAQSVPDLTIPDLYLRGEFNSWGTDNQFTFVETNASSENVYTISIASLEGSFKIADATWTENNNFGGSEAISITSSVVGSGVALVTGSNTQNIVIPVGYTLENAVLTLYVKTDNTAWLDVQGTLKSDEIVIYDAYVVGSMFDNWSLDSARKMTIESNDNAFVTYTLKVSDVDFDGVFKIIYADEDGNLSWSNPSFGSNESEVGYIPYDESAEGYTGVTEFTESGQSKVAIYGSSVNFYAHFKPETTITYHANYSVAEVLPTIEVSSTGGLSSVANINVDASLPIEYFNLNGVRVNSENLTPGIYIRRQGSNVTKLIRK